ncbi:hypothetical protein Tsubulata_008990 [Turnera subulata]|uniref:WRKY domain-containing protein n=1 Tax=Turnera subulata TaxID=218843 RepID=A0A9Q0FIN7_9ROSI|nr:hypothetical protein Tsubulata_008990 [Turnera subulata]
MEGREAPPIPLPSPLLQLPPQNPPPPYLFTSSMLPSASLQPPPPPISHEPHRVLPDIDWVSLLSGQAGLGENSRPLMMESTSSVMAEQYGADQESMKGSRDKKKGGSRMKKASRPRFAFQTRSAEDILDDGYRWRKYGQKAVKNSKYPRCASYSLAT